MTAVRHEVQIVIFDLDGTLTDSQEGIVASFRHALHELGVHADDELIRRQIGPPLPDGFAAMGVPTERVDLAVHTYRSFFSETGIYMNRLYDGIEAMLIALHGSGLGLALATSKWTEFAQRILDHFGIAYLFSAIAGSTLDGRILTKEAVVADALRRLGEPESSGVVLAGDRDQDMRAATRHRLLPVGVVWGYGSARELLDSGARHLVASPSELCDLLLGE